MSTAPASQPLAEATTQVTQPMQPVLDQAIEATTKQVQSIRHTAAMFLGVPPSKVCDLLRNVWSVSIGKEPLSDQEMFMGMSLIARYGLDPIAREVYVTRDGKGRLMTIIGIDGWIKILDRTDHYDGFEQSYGFKDDGKTLEYVETTIHSKSRSYPTVYRAFMHEYMKLAGFMGEKIPWHMLRLFSLRHAARLFTPVGGSVVTEEEARWMQAYEPEEKAAAEAPKKSDRAVDELKRRRAVKPEPVTEGAKAPGNAADGAAQPEQSFTTDTQPPQDFEGGESVFLDVIDNFDSPLELAKCRQEILASTLPKTTKVALFTKLDAKVAGLKKGGK